MGDQELKQLLEMIKEALGRMGLDSALGDFKDNIDDNNKGLTKQERLVKNLNERFDKVNKELDKGRKKILDLGSTIKDLDDQIEDLEDSHKKQVLQERKDLLEKQFISASYKKAAKDFTVALGDVLVKGTMRSTKTLVNGLQSNASGISIAGSLMTDAIQSSQDAVNAGTKTAETLGGGLSSLGGKAGKFGIGLQVAAGAVSYFSNAVSDASKFAVEMLTKEVEKTVAAFNNATSAGALFGKGMDDMRFYSSRAGLTVEQFSNVIKNNNQVLADSGLTVTGAVRVVANVTSKLATQTGKSGQTLQREMLNLGVGFEEQAAITAQVVGDLKRTGSRATNSEVAQATVNIAKNMKAVADIMGEEAKGRQEAAKKAAEQYAFQAKLREVAAKIEDPTKRAEYMKNIETSMAAMTGPMRRSAMQEFVSGVTTDVSAILSGAAGAGKDWAQVALSGETDMAKLTESTGKLNDQFQSGTNEMGIAISKVTMLTGDMAEHSAAFDEQMRDSYKLNSANIKQALADAEAAAAASGQLHNAVIGAEVEAQKLKLALQDTLTPAIKEFAKVTNKVLEGVKKQLEKAGFEVGGGKAENNRDWWKIAQGAALATAGVVGGVLTSWTGIGGAAGVAAATTGAQMMYSGWENEEGYAEGGISTGSVSGHQEVLHGTEAVVPLPDGRTIPVEIQRQDYSALQLAIGQLTSEVQAGNRGTNDNLQDLIRIMKDNTSYTQQVATNTN